MRAERNDQRSAQSWFGLTLRMVAQSVVKCKLEMSFQTFQFSDTTCAVTFSGFNDYLVDNVQYIRRIFLRKTGAVLITTSKTDHFVS